MRNLFIITALALSLFSNAQKMSKEFLEGKWKSETVEITFSGTNKKDFKIESFSTLSQNSQLVFLIRCCAPPLLLLFNFGIDVSKPTIFNIPLYTEYHPFGKNPLDNVAVLRKG